jgi:hypothetical protein
VLEVADHAPPLEESSDLGPSLNAGACCHLPLFGAQKGQEKGNRAESRFLAPRATRDIHDLEAGGFRDCELTIIGRRKYRTHHHSGGSYVQQIQAPSEKFGSVRS